jgi:hypothetical protein
MRFDYSRSVRKMLGFSRRGLHPENLKTRTLLEIHSSKQLSCDLGMSFVEALVHARQQSIESFLTCGGDNTGVQGSGYITALFTRDAALLSHAAFSTSIANCRGFGTLPVNDVIFKRYAMQLYSDPLDIATPTTYSARHNKYGISTVQFDHQGALLAAGGSNGIVRIYDSDEYCVQAQLR